MRILRFGLVLGLVAAAAACGGDDAAPATDPTDPTTVGSTSAPATTAAPSTTAEPAATVVTTAPPATPATTETAPATTEPPPTTPPTTDAPATTAAPALTEVRVYLLRDERLAIVRREVPGPEVLRAALTEVVEGPTEADASTGLHTQIPAGTQLRDVNLRDGTATVDLSREFESGGGSMSMQARLGQVVFTATQFGNVDRVVFWLDGGPVDFLGGEGIVLDEPFDRNDVDIAFTSGILFDSPAYAGTVTSPITVTGEGDVFEGDFPLEIRRDGVRIVGPIVVGAGAWGDWRDFETTVTVDAPPGPIEIVAISDFGCDPDSEPNCANSEVVLPVELAG